MLKPDRFVHVLPGVIMTVEGRVKNGAIVRESATPFSAMLSSFGFAVPSSILERGQGIAGVTFHLQYALAR
ncbi:MAG TPA: hypothetical protein VHZ24_00975 [Pirellulales bacterium]|nr:hypothetical protein [Pirellulales bacterium]